MGAIIGDYAFYTFQSPTTATHKLPLSHPSTHTLPLALGSPTDVREKEEAVADAMFEGWHWQTFSDQADLSCLRIHDARLLYKAPHVSVWSILDGRASLLNCMMNLYSYVEKVSHNFSFWPT